MRCLESALVCPFLFRLRNPMSQLVRREVVETAETIIVKVGTNVLSRDDLSVDAERIAALGEQIHRVLQSRRKVILVSSGAVGAGMSLLGLEERPTDLPRLQAAAATGQAHLIRMYDDRFREHGYHAAQLLLTANDFKNRSRYLNVRNTLRMLFEHNVVPIVNENDTVSVDEVKFGDNDRLAAMLASLMPAPLLVILSAVDGFFDGPPESPDSQVIRQIDAWDDSLQGFAAETRSSLGSGGMSAKLAAIKSATAVGESVILANGKNDRILDQIMNGEEVGTLFLAGATSVPAWKRWIGYTVEPRGQFVLDAGACAAIAEAGRSLLAIGIAAVTGEFEAGEVVALVDENATEFARGLTNYDSASVRAIAGKRGDEIAQVLGDRPYMEVVHRDNLVLMR